MRRPSSCRGRAAQIFFLTFMIESVKLTEVDRREDCAWQVGSMGMAITAIIMIAAFSHALERRCGKSSLRGGPEGRPHFILQMIRRDRYGSDHETGIHP